MLSFKGKSRFTKGYAWKRGGISWFTKKHAFIHTWMSWFKKCIETHVDQLIYNKLVLKCSCISCFTTNMHWNIYVLADLQKIGKSKLHSSAWKQVRDQCSLWLLSVSLIYLLYFVPRKWMSSSRHTLLHLHLSHEMQEEWPEKKTNTIGW